jgi:hypothetical protein
MDYRVTYWSHQCNSSDLRNASPGGIGHKRLFSIFIIGPHIESSSAGPSLALQYSAAALWISRSRQDRKEMPTGSVERQVTDQYSRNANSPHSWFLRFPS